MDSRLRGNDKEDGNDREDWNGFPPVRLRSGLALRGNDRRRRAWDFLFSYVVVVFFYRFLVYVVYELRVILYGLDDFVFSVGMRDFERFISFEIDWNDCVFEREAIRFYPVEPRSEQ